MIAADKIRKNLRIFRGEVNLEIAPILAKRLQLANLPILAFLPLARQSYQARHPCPVANCPGQYGIKKYRSTSEREP